MRFTHGLAVTVAATLLFTCAVRAEEKKTETTRNSNSVVTRNNNTTTNNATTNNTTTNNATTNNATTTEASTQEEKNLFAQLRGYQLLLKKEEQALAQRMAYAQKLRAVGLEKNDQKMLDQAEQYERRAMEYYTNRVQQFEKMRFTTPSTSTQQSNGTTSQPAVRNQPSRGQSNRSASNSSRSRRGR